ncbi:MAG: T9SS type A sorting domain-containing protein [Bacteroidetes bacterium]|nr:MAG: T9SS type A sorting domain-containing protein [Bacteroidota bacterium]
MRELRSLLLILIISQCGYSQSIVSTAGEEFSSSSGRLSWTLGEPVIETVSSTSNILTQGFQQDYLNILSVSQHFNLDDLNIYPNPTRDVLFIHSKDHLQIFIFSTDGKELQLPVEVLNGNYVINTSGLSSGLYHLNILKENQTLELKLFKL